MATLRAFIASRPVVAYFILAFAISWGSGLLAIGGAGGMQGTTPGSDPRFAYAVLGMLLGPSLAGVLMTRLAHGPEGLRQLLQRTLKWRVDAQWYVVALFTAPCLMLITLFALSLTSPAFLPGLLTSKRHSTFAHSTRS